MEQVNIFESLTGSDLGISVGVINKQYWETNRVYYVNIERGMPEDKETPRNVVVSFNNNSGVKLDCLIFIYYLDQIHINVLSGEVKK